MSASKLIIHKFEANSINFKSLQVTIEDDDSNNFRTQYGEWIDGTIHEKKKDVPKSSRLIVKIVSEKEIDGFGLESNAKEIDDVPANITNFTKYNRTERERTESSNRQDMEYLNCEDITNINSSLPARFQGSVSYNRGFQNKSNLDEEDLSPLEYSLVKVKENNARIMENIHLLNRTLNYTKKKEILDMICPKSIRPYPCSSCGKCFVYETGLRRHYSMRHAMTAVQPRWQVVWTCIRCFQVWPRQDQALHHSSECCKSDNKDCVLEIKASSLLQCEYCEKVYTSIPRLLRHSKTHTTNKNYECNACKMAFSSYIIAEKHWLTCPWLKMCYGFSLPKLLLCNACDRKFRNYEQLYNHRYKVDHFMTKTHCNPYSTTSFSILVYQCEMCGSWYPSIATLKEHRNQYHTKHDIAMQSINERNLNKQNDYISFENRASQNE